MTLKSKKFDTAKIGSLFSKLGLNPSTWTVISIIPALVGFYFFTNRELVLGLLSFILAAFFDVIDGAVARVTGQVSKIGGFLDTVIDRVVEILFFLSLVFLELPDFYFIPISFWIVLITGGSLLVSYTKAAASYKGILTTEEELKNLGGLMERFERMSLLFLGILLVILFGEEWILTWTIVLVTILILFTFIQRILKVCLITPPPTPAIVVSADCTTTTALTCSFGIDRSTSSELAFDSGSAATTPYSVKTSSSLVPMFVDPYFISAHSESSSISTQMIDYCS